MIVINHEFSAASKVINAVEHKDGGGNPYFIERVKYDRCYRVVNVGVHKDISAEDIVCLAIISIHQRDNEVNIVISDDENELRKCKIIVDCQNYAEEDEKPNYQMDFYNHIEPGTYRTALYTWRKLADDCIANVLIGDELLEYFPMDTCQMLDLAIKVESEICKLVRKIMNYVYPQDINACISEASWKNSDEEWKQDQIITHVEKTIEAIILKNYLQKMI